MSSPGTEIRIPTLEETTVLSAEDKAFLREVAAKVRAVEPGAELLLYGSRGRGDAREDSDWDILAIVDREDVRQLRREVFRALYEYGTDERTFLEVMYVTRERWEADRNWLEYFRNVTDDAVAL